MHFNNNHNLTCDASANEKYYHRTCMRTAQRMSETELNTENKSLIHSLCDDELILAIQNTLADNVTLNMTQVNDAYLSISESYNVDIRSRVSLPKLFGLRGGQ